MALSILKGNTTADAMQELSKFIFTSKYARFIDDEQRRENWDEAVLRVRDMHLKKFRGKLTTAERKEIKDAFQRVIDNKSVMPSMRSLQFGGKAVEAVNLRLFNCSVRHVDSIRSMAEIFYLLLCGCGVGIGLSNHFLARFPDIVNKKDRTGTVVTYVVEDTIEGWADSLEALLMCYTRGNAWSGRKIVFDYSKIRPKGSRLKTGGGKAPGHEPLKKAHGLIKNLLIDRIEVQGQKRLRSIDVYDILMHVADCVLSGGVRRSACSVIFDKDDELMLGAKTGDWINQNPQRLRSNNSVLLLRDEVSGEEFKEIAKRTKEWGEPGFLFADDPHTLMNPCFEVGFIPVTEDGVCGVQTCNLTSINASVIETEEDFYQSARDASLIGTLQATYTDFPYLSTAAKQLTEEEALLGVSITAMLEKPSIILDPIIQQKAAVEVKATNERWAKILGIQPAARTTVIKPEGTGSLAVGTMANGIHPAHSRYMIRRVQCNKDDNVFQHFAMHNPHMVEDYLYSDNDAILSFPIKVPDEALVKEDLDALSHLDIIKSTQTNWIIPGTTEFNRKRVSHNVSCTVLVKDHEWASVIDFLYFNRHFFSAVSLLPHNGDQIYAQAPFEKVEKDDTRFNNFLNNLKEVDYTTMQEWTDETEHVQEAACAGGACEI